MTKLIANPSHVSDHYYTSPEKKIEGLNRVSFVFY